MKLRWIERKELVQADVGCGAATIKTVKVLQYWDEFYRGDRYVANWVDVPTVTADESVPT